MARVKHSGATRKRHKRTLKQAKGAWGKRSKIFRRAKETVYRGMAFATRDRKARKGAFRRLWVTRIRAACNAEGLSYSKFMAQLKAAKVELNHKMLADLAATDGKAFREIVQIAKSAPAKKA